MFAKSSTSPRSSLDPRLFSTGVIGRVARWIVLGRVVVGHVYNLPFAALSAPAPRWRVI